MKAVRARRGLAQLASARRRRPPRGEPGSSGPGAAEHEEEPAPAAGCPSSTAASAPLSAGVRASMGEGGGVRGALRSRSNPPPTPRYKEPFPPRPSPGRDLTVVNKGKGRKKSDRQAPATASHLRGGVDMDFLPIKKEVIKVPF